MKELPREDLTLEKLKDFIAKANDFYDTIICYSNPPKYFKHELVFTHNGHDYIGCFVRICIYGEWKDMKRTRRTDIGLAINDKIVLSRQDFNSEELADFYNKALIFAEEMCYHR